MSFYGISTFGKVSKVIKVIKMSVISVIFTGFLRSACPNKLFWTFWIFGFLDLRGFDVQLRGGLIVLDSFTGF